MPKGLYIHNQVFHILSILFKPLTTTPHPFFPFPLCIFLIFWVTVPLPHSIFFLIHKPMYSFSVVQSLPLVEFCCKSAYLQRNHFFSFSICSYCACKPGPATLFSFQDVTPLLNYLIRSADLK